MDSRADYFTKDLNSHALPCIPELSKSISLGDTLSNMTHPTFHMYNFFESMHLRKRFSFWCLLGFLKILSSHKMALTESWVLTLSVAFLEDNLSWANWDREGVGFENWGYNQSYPYCIGICPVLHFWSPHQT